VEGLIDSTVFAIPLCTTRMFSSCHFLVLALPRWMFLKSCDSQVRSSFCPFYFLRQCTLIQPGHHTAMLCFFSGPAWFELPRHPQGMPWPPLSRMPLVAAAATECRLSGEGSIKRDIIINPSEGHRCRVLLHGNMCRYTDWASRSALCICSLLHLI